MIVFTIEAEHKFYKALFTASRELKGSYDDIILAGGACRDSLLETEIKDYDVFVLNPSKTVASKLKKIGTQKSKYVLGQPLDNNEEVYLETYNITDNIQVILTSIKDVGELLNTFDYDFCQVGFTVDQVHCTPVFEDFYMQDDDVNYVTLTNSTFEGLKTYPKLERLSKFHRKFPEYKFRDKEGTILDSDLLTKLGLGALKTRLGPYKDSWGPIKGNPARFIADDVIVNEVQRPRRINVDIEAWQPPPVGPNVPGVELNREQMDAVINEIRRAIR